jgi:hypothetical protein
MSFPRWRMQAARILIGLTIGSCLSAALWAVIIAIRGQNLLDALQGQVEDALGILQALIAFGVLVGTFVGLVWGLGVEPVGRTSPNERADNAKAEG